MTKVEVSQFEDTEAARAHYLRRVDEIAGSVRARHVTDLPGQSAVYEYKRTDAERFKADDEPDDPDAYPWVAAEADALDDTMSEAADTILGRANTIWTAAIDLERERMKAKYAVRDASSPREMHDAVEDARSAMEAVDTAF